MPNYVEVFNASYERVNHPPDAFYDTFYKRVIASSPAVAEKFANTDFHRQRRALRKSLLTLLDFYLTKEGSPELEAIARKHSRREHDVGPELYDLWLESLIETVRAHDARFDAHVDLAWRVVLAPGIEYMKYMYDRF